MYKLMIAEDEISFRDGIRSLIDWQSEGIQVISVASNGHQALEMIEADPPDILLSDIRMPRMSGLALVEEIAARKLDMITVLLSGYGEFQYAQEAIKLGVFEYVLKPCEPNQVLDVIVRAKDELIRRRSQLQQLHQIRQQWNANVRSIKEDRLKNWLRSGPKIPAQRLAEALEFGIRLEDRPTQAVVFRFDAQVLKKQPYGDEDMPLIRYAAANIIEESLGSQFPETKELLTLEDQFVLIANVPESAAEISPALAAAQRNLSDFLRVSASIGVGMPKCLNEVHLSYEEALEALSHRFFHGGSGLFVASRTAEADKEEPAGSQDNFPVFVRRIRAYVDAGSYSDFVSEVDAWLETLREQKLSTPRIRLHAYAILDGLLNEVQAAGGEKAGECATRLESYSEQVNRQETFEELSTLLTVAIQTFVAFMNSRKSMHKTIRQVLQLIEEKYMSNLTLKSIAEEAFISPSHLSTLFRQEMGINFLDYLHQLRINKAKQLLKEEHSKVYAVAREVGYYDEAHFVRFFKKWTGMLPSQYKKQTGSQ